ncbi:ubiquinone biosynthesis protein COQ9, mitochondrial-like [Ipomoea triloba]|uniref:ubiquinone biosynthesis protein COQ9, mitochondrial-like n=1 Tax=Ipomoea triloba TaxID=35885 RepID=UPI00125E67B7|nr:ubiquinone biosynthesis protein COQ9, mitochondrial-like [Ipomoea triloba]
MYRTAARRLFPALRRCNAQLNISSNRALGETQSPRFFNSVVSENIPNQSSTHSHYESSSPSTASNASSARNDDETARGYEKDGKSGSRTKSSRPKAHYQDEQARVLTASLPHVIRLGWTEAAMIAGARDVGVSPSIVGSFASKEAALVEFFMDDCLERLIDIIDAREDLKTMIPSERVATLIRLRLEMQAPYLSKWAQALSIQAQPLNIPTSFRQRAMLIDEICHAAGDEADDIDWYVKRTVLGGMYSTTELYMLTDHSPDFRDTWKFLDARIRDAFDLRKTANEAKNLAEAVGAGMGGSLQGLMKSIFRG